MMRKCGSMTDSFSENLSYVLDCFSGDKKPEARKVELKCNIECALIFIDEITDGKLINKDIIKPLFDAEIKFRKNIAEELKEKIIPANECEIIYDREKLPEFILDGCVVLIIESADAFLSVPARKWEKRSVEEPPNEAVIRGPREGFTEDLKTNISLLRKRLKTPDLAIDIIKTGRYSDTKSAVVYISSIADKQLVSSIKEKLSEIDIDGIIDSEYLEGFLKDNKFTVFPQTGITEKPDTAAGKLLEGRICIITDGSPSVITLPYLFIESFQDAGDYYSVSPRKSTLRALRFAGFIFAILLPGLYVSILNFHYEMLPAEILLTILNARDGIPMNPVLELIITMLLFEILQEASIRMPRHLGSAMSIVGALILGDTAVKSGVISSPAVMISAVSAIAIYSVPDQADAVILLRFCFTILGGMAGFFGIMLGAAAVSIHLLSLSCFGVSYLAPFAPLSIRDKQDAVFISPITKRYFRPESIPTKNRVRMRSKT